MPDTATFITGFHAHVYYDPATRHIAERLREGLAGKFEVQLGRWHDKPIGPHPRSMYQVAFAPTVFAPLVSWMIGCRSGSTRAVSRRVRPARQA